MCCKENPYEVPHFLPMQQHSSMVEPLGIPAASLFEHDRLSPLDSGLAFSAVLALSRLLRCMARSARFGLDWSDPKVAQMVA